MINRRVIWLFGFFFCILCFFSQEFFWLDVVGESGVSVLECKVQKVWIDVGFRFQLMQDE